MGQAVNIRGLSAHKLSGINIKCVNCSFWFNYEGGNFLEEISRIESFSDFRRFINGVMVSDGYARDGEKKLAAFVEKGGIVKGAFKNRECIGILIAGKFWLFPKLKSFKVFPPDMDSIFLGCIYVEPGHRDTGIEKRLLIELEKHLLDKRFKAIETIGKRLDDDIDREEYDNSPLIPFKFLINNGFYLKKNDDHYPLLRLDLKSIARRFSLKEASMEKLAYKKTVRGPVAIRRK